jgi:hypothetical protein
VPRRAATVQARGREPLRRVWWLFAIVFLIGVAGAVFFIQQGIRDYRVFHVYQPAECTVMGKGAIAGSGVGRAKSRSSYVPEYLFEHRLNGKLYTTFGYDNMDGLMGEADSFSVGRAYPCWYDPADPEQAVIARRVYPLFYTAALIPLAFLLIGGSFLWGALGPKPVIAIADGGRADVLAVRLAPELSRSAGLIGIAFLLVLWSIGLFVAITWMVRDSIRIEDWWFFLLIAVAAEVGLVRFAISGVRAMIIPDPIVELDHEPMRPGDKMRVSIRQGGPARFDFFKVFVVCEQNDRGATKEKREQILMKKDLNLGPAPIAHVMDAAIASNAAVSDKALQSFTTWKIVVKRARKGFVGLDREYVFRVVER